MKTYYLLQFSYSDKSLTINSTWSEEKKEWVPSYMISEDVRLVYAITLQEAIDKVKEEIPTATEFVNKTIL